MKVIGRRDQYGQIVIYPEPRAVKGWWTGAIRYAEGKYGRPVRLVMRPENEVYPPVWRDADARRDVPVRADRRVLPHHLYLVTGVAQGAAQAEEQAV